MVSASGSSTPRHGQEWHAGSGNICCLATETETPGSQGPAAVATGPGSNVFPFCLQRSSLCPPCSFRNEGAGPCCIDGTLVNVRGRFTLQAAHPPYHARPCGKPAASRAPAQPHSPLLDPCVQCTDHTQHLQLRPAWSCLLRAGSDAPCHSSWETGLRRAS